MAEHRDVVLITVDCLRADHVGCYGYDRDTTPNIDAFAGANTRFANSYANAPGTRWALQLVHTGVFPSEIDGLGIPDSGTVTLSEVFEREGYATAGFADNGFLTRDYDYHIGFDRFDDVNDFEEDESLLKRLGRRANDFLGRRFHKQFAAAYNLIQQTSSSIGGGYQPKVTDEEVVDRTIDWIERQDQPYFCWVHLMDAHTPYARWEDHLEVIRGDTEVEHVIDPELEGQVAAGEEPPQAVIDAYDAAVRSADEQIGRLLDAAPEDAVVCITGDHGEEFGRFGRFHEASLYSSMTQVPLLLRAPTVERGVLDAVGQHLDIPPTLVNATGTTVPDVWRGSPLGLTGRPIDTPVFFDVGDEHGDIDELYGVREGNWKIIENRTTDTEEVYETPHMSSDETELVSADEEVDEIRADLRETLSDHHKEMRTLGRGSRGMKDVSPEVRNNLEELGYID